MVSSMRSPTAAAIYCRISRDSTGAAVGVERQETLCRKLADSKGWPVAEVYVDNDLSAFTGKRRPAYQRMLDDLRAGIRDAVVVVDQDRLTRHTRELEEFIGLADDLGIPLANVSGDLDLSSSDGRFRARIMGAVARQESEKKSERLKRERDQRAAKGLPHPGPRWFGWRDGNLERDPVEARLIRNAAKRILAGESMASIAREWNDRGVRTTRGNRWSVNSLRDVLTSPRMAALRQHRGEIIGDGAWQPILDRDQWERLCALARRRARPGRPQTRLLSGILRCGRCQQPMVSHTDHGVRYYRCWRGPKRDAEGCGRLSVVAGPCDEFVSEAVLHRLSSGALTQLLAQQSDRGSEEVTSDLEDAEARLEQLADDYADGKVTRAMFLRTSERLETRIERAKAALAKRTNGGVLAALPRDEDALRKWWNSASTSVDQKRGVLDAVLVHITVKPFDQRKQRRFDPSRLEPEWRA